MSLARPPVSLARSPVARLADDGCPGALRVHQAADGGLVRIRLPGGVISLRQWAALRAEAPRGLELTSRANVQIRGVSPDAASVLAERLNAVGLLGPATHERVRNIVASPLSSSPLVAALDAGLCADPALALLSGRFLFAVDDGSGDVSGLGADAGIIPVGTGVVALLLAGVDSGVRVGTAQAVAALLAAARGFLAEREAQASGAWRLSELDQGVARVTARVRACLLTACLSPAGQWPVPPSALAPRTTGPVGVVSDPEGLVAVGAVAPLGRLTTTQALVLESVAGRYAAAGRLVVTPWRGVVIPGLDQATAPAALAALTAAGLITDPASPWASATACTGLPGCAKALADVRADAAVVLESVPAAVPADVGGDPLRAVHWVGCGRHCGRPAGEVIEVLAVADGYDVEGVIYRTDELPAVLAATRRTR